MTTFEGLGRSDVVTSDEMVSVEDHLAGILELVHTAEPIDLRLVDALGLVIAQDVVSEVSIPAFPNSAMDGYAVSSADLAHASPEAPVTVQVVGEIVAGEAAPVEVAPGSAARIMTGAPLPVGSDAVVPVEVTSSSGPGDVTFRAPVERGRHVRWPGEDLKPGQPLIARGRRVTPAEIAVLATAGVTRVTCVPPPRVVTISTGNELVRAESEPGPGQIRDSNGPMLTTMVRAAGGLPFSAGIVPDDRRELIHAFDTNSGHADLFVCTGGASAGTLDLMPDVIAALGEVWKVKVAMRPGMPQIRGRIGGVPVIGLPGNPVSAFVSFEVFARPAIRRLQGRRDVARPTVTATVTEALTAPEGKRGYSRVRLRRDGARWLATPTGPQGSHVTSSIAAADGLAIVPEHLTEIPVGETVTVQLLLD